MAPKITIADIDRWNPDDIDKVFQVCTQHADHCDERANGLGNLSAFDSWDGDAAAAAKHSVGKTRVDFDAHGQHVAAIADAAKTAASEVATVKTKLAGLRAQAGQSGFAIGDDGTVRQTINGPFTADRQQILDNEKAGLQVEVNQLLINAQLADADLAAAIKGADGEMSIDDLSKNNHPPIYASVYGLGSLGIPDYPDQSLDSLQTRNYYLAAERKIDEFMAKIAADPKLSLEDKAKIGWALRNELRTRARQLMSDQAEAAKLFQNRPNKGFEELIQDKMARKGFTTREQALQDILDTASKSNAEVNAALGVDPKTAKFPDPKSVKAPPGAPAGENFVPNEDVAAGAGGESAAARGLRIAGKAALPVAAAVTIYDDYQQVQNGQETVPQAVGHSGGAVAGMVAGGELGAEGGAVVGSFAGPVGTVVGGAVGGVVGGIAGAISGGEVGKWIGGLF